MQDNSLYSWMILLKSLTTIVVGLSIGRAGNHSAGSVRFPPRHWRTPSSESIGPLLCRSSFFHLLGDLTNRHVPSGMRSLLSNFNTGSVILGPLTEAISLFMNCHRSTGVGRLCASMHDHPTVGRACSILFPFRSLEMHIASPGCVIPEKTPVFLMSIYDGRFSSPRETIPGKRDRHERSASCCPEATRASFGSPDLASFAS
jgi:hypothetical protein